jgi:S-adenosylhomocysteine hydrolase
MTGLIKTCFEKLPVLNLFIKKSLSSIEPTPLTNTTVVYVHHALDSSLSLLKAKIQLGLQPKNIFVLNKHYSECRSVVLDIKNMGINYQPCSEQVSLGRFSHSFTYDISLLWHKVLSARQETDNLIIMDHGGYALNYIPSKILKMYNVIGIEKTTGGFLTSNLEGLPFPIIDIATCAAKRILESPLIAEAVVAKLMPLIPIKQNYLTCSVIGYGAIGKAIAKKLTSIGHRVITHDKNSCELEKKEEIELIITNNLTAAIEFSDYIFGCTGQDITSSIDLFRWCPKDKVLISCSSEDKEFLSLIRYIQRKRSSITNINPLSDIIWKNDAGANIRIVRGGFPINFDGSNESVPNKDIQLTRSLVLAGTLQAVEIFKKNSDLIKQSRVYMLNPSIQKFIVNEWVKVQNSKRFDRAIISKFQDEKWIIKNSGGIYFEDSTLMPETSYHEQQNI